MGLEGSWGLVRRKTPAVSMCNSDVRDVQNEGEAVQAGFFLYVLFQMKNEQCGIARVLSGLPLVIVGSEYVANQPFGRLPLGRERDDLRGVRGDYMLCPLLHVIERVVVFPAWKNLLTRWLSTMKKPVLNALPDSVMS